MSATPSTRRRRRPFRKVLVANRGEIASRIFRTCRRLGIRTVAVHSEADTDAVFVGEADEAVKIGPASAARSYLDHSAVLKAAKETKSEAIHPGYGFLSENAGFARAVEKTGLVFVGPHPKTIALMGDKLTAKALAAKASINVIPGSSRPASSAATAAQMAKRIGYPVMLKAAAGGGGKGMRIARNTGELREMFPRAAGEAKSSFGDGRIFVERYFPDPRHIEIQVLADNHGNCISLGERECSIQRRHQKVLEEAPATIDADTRANMEEQAVRLARAANYRSAGTVEFVLDAEGGFHFLEMNTRLQVEHPVTEMVTGIDLVEEMLHIAAGETLALRQEDVHTQGWAIEARVYAEDPLRDFLPSIGRIRHLEFPPGTGKGQEGPLRIDSGIVEGSEITPHYDPMIAKVVAYGANRPGAVEILRDALDGCYVRGPATNLEFLSDVVRRPRFRKGDLDTGFIEREYPKGFRRRKCTGVDRDTLIAATALAELRREARNAGRTLTAGEVAERVVAIDGQSVEARISIVEDGCDIEIEERLLAVRSEWSPGEVVFRGLVNNRHVSVRIDPAPEGNEISHGGLRLRVALRRPEVDALAVHLPARRIRERSGHLRSPMPGLVLSIEVKDGDKVRTGQVIAVVEAMKVENALRSERDGTVKAIRVNPGDNIAADDIIVELV